MTNKPSSHQSPNDSLTKTLILRGISFIFLLIAMVSGFLFYREYQVYRHGVDAYAEIANTVIMNVNNSGTDQVDSRMTIQTQAVPELNSQTGHSASLSSSEPAETPSADQLDYQRIRKLLNINFDRLTSINPDAIGWIFSENTQISYPFVQGRDNAYYLTRLVSNEVNKLGSIFMDYRNRRDFSDGHTLIYGHNTKDGSMFNDLERYKDPNYFPDHNTIYVLTAEQIYRVDVFAAYMTTPQKIGQIDFNFDTQEAREQYISEARRLSNFQSEVVLSEEDRIVSLFTCDYATEDTRYVVIGKLVPLNP